MSLNIEFNHPPVIPELRLNIHHTHPAPEVIFATAGDMPLVDLHTIIAQLGADIAKFQAGLENMSCHNREFPFLHRELSADKSLLTTLQLVLNARAIQTFVAGKKTEAKDNF